MNIERNGASLEFGPTPFKRGDNKGATYLATEVTADNLQEVIRFLDSEMTASIIDRWLKQQAQGWTSEATTDDGLLDEREFVSFVQGMSARGESIPAIRERIAELVSKIGDVVDQPLEVGKLAVKIKALNAAIEGKRRNKADTEAVTT